MKHEYRIFARFENENNGTFIGEETANSEYEAKQQLAARQGQTLTEFFGEMKQNGVKSLVAKKQYCLCADCAEELKNKKI